MFFWFKRREDLLRYEARQLPSGEFEFCVIDEHGKQLVETFQNGDALHARQLDFERRIKEEGGPARTAGTSSSMGSLGLPQLVTLFAAILIIWWIFNRRGGVS
jgi:hypothetical protein